MAQAGANRAKCTRLHLLTAQAAFREHRNAILRLIPWQGNSLLAEVDRTWDARRDELCGSVASTDCLIQSLNDRTASLIGLRKFWENRQKTLTSAAPMAAASLGLDSEHDEQVRRFWDWVQSFPTEAAPVADQDGSRCALHQLAPWWFLAGSNSEGVVRRFCILPIGRPLVVPVLAIATPADPVGCAKTRLFFLADLLDTSRMDVELDGAALPRNAWPRMHMICLPHPDGKRALLVAGWWLHLPPLAPGAHRLAYRAHNRKLGVDQNVVYYLVVQ